MNGSVTLPASVNAALPGAVGLLRDIGMTLFCEKVCGKAKTTFFGCGEIHRQRTEKRKSENDEMNGTAKQMVSDNEAAALAV